MASWCDSKLFLCILVVICYCTVTLAQVPTDCCLSVKNQTIPKPVVADYRHQPSGQGCAIEATVLVTRVGKTLCVPPHESWVQDLKVHVDKLKKFCKDSNYKLKRCFGVNPQ